MSQCTKLKQTSFHFKKVLLSEKDYQKFYRLFDKKCKINKNDKSNPKELLNSEDSDFVSKFDNYVSKVYEKLNKNKIEIPKFEGIENVIIRKHNIKKLHKISFDSDKWHIIYNMGCRLAIKIEDKKISLNCVDVLIFKDDVEISLVTNIIHFIYYFIIT